MSSFVRRDAGDGLPRRAVALEVGDERGVDHVALEAVEEDGGHEPAVLADLGEDGVGGPGQDDVGADPGDLVGLTGPPEQEVVDLGLPRPEAGTRARAARAALLAVRAVLRPEPLFGLERLVDAGVVAVAEHVVGARDDTARAPGAEPARHDLFVEVLPLQLLRRHRVSLARRHATGPRRTWGGTARLRFRVPRDEQVDVAKISDILAGGRSISFEFFPPRTPEAEVQLERTLVELEPLHPSYVSVTYGAGGTTRERTHDLVVHINQDTSMTAMAHLTCAAHTRAELDDIVTHYRDSSIENILALGGDPPKELDLPPGELEHAIDLVRLVRGIGDFSIGVAVHPEPHPRSPSLESDRRYTAEKLAEADFGVTQFFFEPHHYFELLDALDAARRRPAGDPGDHAGAQHRRNPRMTELQGSAFPGWLAARLHEVEDDPAAVRAVGIEEATRLCAALLRVARRACTSTR